MSLPNFDPNLYVQILEQRVAELTLENARQAAALGQYGERILQMETENGESDDSAGRLHSVASPDSEGEAQEE